MDVSATSSASELSRALARGDVTAVDLLDLYRERIGRLDGAVNSVVTTDFDGARAAAARADDERRRGRVRGPLHGLPITVKDALETSGLRSTGGAVELAGHVPGRDAPAVARLRAAGAIVFGKTNLPRWSRDVQSFNELFGTTANPWRPDLSPGGSSGGAAAAVACGFTAFEVGTDIGGSIRIPAHLCGVYGLRPSYGLVPQDGYLAGPHRYRGGHDLNVVGPLARTAGDLALVLDVLAGPAPDDARAWTLRLPPPPPTLPGCRIGLWLDDDACPVDRAYGQVLAALADRLADAGARVAHSRPALRFDDAAGTYRALADAANCRNADDVTAGPPDHREWQRHDDERHRQYGVWRDWFGGFDVLLAPVTAAVAYPHDHTGSYLTREVRVDGVARTHADTIRWRALANAVGLPTAVAPAGRVRDGLPVGVQIIGARWADRTVVEVARWVGEISGGYRPPPGFDVPDPLDQTAKRCPSC